MPPRDERPRGNIVPFPVAAIRRPPSPAFVTQPATPARMNARRRIALLWLALASLLAAVLAVLVLRSAAPAGARSALLEGGAPAAERPPGGHALPRATVPGSANLLIAGLAGDDGSRDERGMRSDAIVLLHLDADRARAWLVSIPPDTRVNIPGQGEDRLDAAYALGGPASLVETLERLTGLPIDHLAVIDRTGFRRLFDGVGGVAVSLDPPGTLELEMNGDMAVEYAGERTTAGNGELDRIRREHHVLRALLARLLERGTLADPLAVRELAAALGTSVRVDAGLTPPKLLALLESASRLRLEDVTFLAAPVSSAGSPGEASPRPAEDAGCARLWDAMARDDLPAFVSAHPELVTPDASD